MTGRGHPLDRNPGLAALARVQCGVVSRKQLASLEITRHHLRRQVEAQRWRMVGGRVVVLHTGPLTRHQMYWVAVLHAGPAAKIAGLTALELSGLPTPRRQMVIETPDGPRPVDLVVDLPDGSRLVIEVDGPHHADPSVRLADSVKDAALIAAGYLVLRVPVAALRADPGAVLRQLVSIREAAARRAAPAPSGVSRNAS
jgi:very-short-patch-repair endonuclease